MGDIATKGNRLTKRKGPHGHASQPHLSVHAKGGRAGKFGGGRTNLLEELGRVEAEPSNRNRRAEISRVHGELNRGYAEGGRAGYAIGGGVLKHAIKKLRPGGPFKPKKKVYPETEDLVHQKGPYVGDVGSEKTKKAKEGTKKKKYTKKQQELQKTIKEKKAKYRNRPQGKTFDASPIQLAKAGMTESKKYGLPIHSQTFINGKLTKTKPYGGTIDTGFKGYDKSTPGVGLKSGGRTGFKKGTDRKWIQKAVNPKHKGYCTPMTKKTCTPARKALARTFKKKAKTGWS
jgi:hypothetical protein